MGPGSSATGTSSGGQRKGEVPIKQAAGDWQAVMAADSRAGGVVREEENRVVVGLGVRARRARGGSSGAQCDSRLR